MTASIFWLIAGLIAGIGVSIFIHKIWGKPKPQPVNVDTIFERVEAVGTLEVLRVYMKEVASVSDHLFGTLGRYFTWLLTPKKAIMIFHFVASFKCDLKKARVEPIDEGGRSYRILLPIPNYDVLMRDFTFYDSQGAKLLGIVNLPALVGQDAIDEADKNKLKDEAKNQAIKAVEEDLEQLLDQASVSVRNTLQHLLLDFGITLDVMFANEQSKPAMVTFSEAKAA
jgi:hypothetical protein